MAKSWSPKSNKSEKRSAETSECNRGKPSRGQGWGRGGGKPPPGLGGLGGSEVQKEKRFGGSVKGGSERRGIGRAAGDSHADPMGRPIIHIYIVL